MNVTHSPHHYLLIDHPNFHQRSLSNFINP